MRFDPQAGLTGLTPGGKQRRRHGRLEQEAVTCDLGTVLDLSASGMRIGSRRVPKGDFVVCIRGYDIAVVVTGRLAWQKKVGLFRHELGVEFIDLTEEMSRQLNSLAMNHRQRRVI